MDILNIRILKKLCLLFLYLFLKQSLNLYHQASLEFTIFLPLPHIIGNAHITLHNRLKFCFVWAFLKIVEVVQKPLLQNGEKHILEIPGHIQISEFNASISICLYSMRESPITLAHSVSEATLMFRKQECSDSQR